MDDVTAWAERGMDRLAVQDVGCDRVRQDLRRVAHDVNDMLTTIVGNADLISYDAELSEAGREDLAEIRRAAEALREIALCLVDQDEAAFTSLEDSWLQPQLRLPI